MSIVRELAGFVDRAHFDDLSPMARAQLRIRILDSIACALGALPAQLMRRIHEHTLELGSGGACTLIGGGRSVPDRAAFHNGALVRYLDFNDSYLALGETCHPSDNLAPVLAAAEYADASGQTLLTALAVAYQVQTRLSDEAPVRARGFDHATQGAYAVAAGVAKALGLDPVRTANAIAISGTAQNPLRVTRTGTLSNWKGLAYPHAAFVGTHAAFLAMHGITGPGEVFEGNKGFMDAIAGRFHVDWANEDLERVRRTLLKRYDAEIHSQSAIEGILELRARHPLDPARVERIDVDTFEVAYNIIGGGEEGNKKRVETKEAADHSLPYMIAVALLDGELGPGQYAPERITRPDVQLLLRKVHVAPRRELSERFPAEMPVRLAVILDGGQRLTLEKHDFEGFPTRPMPWEAVVGKLHRLAAAAPASTRAAIVQALSSDDVPRARDLMRMLTLEGGT